MNAAERREAGVESGVIVESVESGSAAREAGLQRGDIILEVGNRTIESMSDYREATGDVGAGDAVLFRVKRGDAKLYIAVEPGE
jgi:S1-C subfamily serine protease